MSDRGIADVFTQEVLKKPALNLDEGACQAIGVSPSQGIIE